VKGKGKRRGGGGVSGEVEGVLEILRSLRLSGLENRHSYVLRILVAFAGSLFVTAVDISVRACIRVIRIIRNSAPLMPSHSLDECLDEWLMNDAGRTFGILESRVAMLTAEKGQDLTEHEEQFGTAAISRA
jgi:hypothetical protein